MKFFYKIFFLLIILFSFNCAVIKNDESDENVEKKDKKNNISTIVGKWRCVDYINDFLGENKNSIYI